ncbi:TPA: hypothetical protein RQN55_004034 [Aeromonas dhakensis]|nr:hypothetical protein [Aeromonas dhakensis]
MEGLSKSPIPLAKRFILALAKRTHNAYRQYTNQLKEASGMGCITQLKLLTSIALNIVIYSEPLLFVECKSSTQ